MRRLSKSERPLAWNCSNLSRAFAEKLIAIDPSYHDAYLAVGIENYLWDFVRRRCAGCCVSREPKPQGQRHRELRITAEKGRYLAPYARLLLAIVALRDQDRSGAVKLCRILPRSFRKIVCTGSNWLAGIHLKGECFHEIPGTLESATGGSVSNFLRHCTPSLTASELLTVRFT